MSYWRADGTTEYSDFFLAPVDQDFANSTTTIAVDFPLGAALRGSVTASHFDDKVEQNQTPDYLTTNRNSVGAQFDYDLSAVQSLSAGAMAIREKADSLSYGESMKADTSYANLFVQDRISRGPHRALLAVGYTNHETAGDYVTWNGEYGYTLHEGTLLYGLAGTGFRAPDATDLYGYGGNPDLDPERSFNIEAGVRHRFDGGHALSLSAFRNEIDDLIEFVVLSYDPFAGQNRNVDRARIEGVEAAYEYASGPWSARVEAIYQDPENQTTGEQLYRRARQSLTVAVARSFGPVDLGLDVLATGERKDFGFPQPVTLDSYVLANVTARWKITRAMSLVAQARERAERAVRTCQHVQHSGSRPVRVGALCSRHGRAHGSRGSPARGARRDIEGRLLGLTWSGAGNTLMGNRLSRIYTRTGDDGSTGLGDGMRVPKEHLRVEAYGTVDEANSAVGVVLAVPGLPQDIVDCLVETQHRLFDLGGELCIPGHRAIEASDVERLETTLDHFNDRLPPLKDFILPGGGPAAAACHVARTVTRRAERRVWALARAENVAPEVPQYLNRLSDLLFVVARVLARHENGSEVLWRHR